MSERRDEWFKADDEAAIADTSEQNDIDADDDLDLGEWGLCQ
jgi:hypothetical protein